MTNRLSISGLLALSAGLIGDVSPARAVIGDVQVEEAPASGAASPCHFDEAAREFQGSALDQMRCLMRPVSRGGKLGAIQPLPADLEELLFRPPRVSKTQLRAWLRVNGVSEIEVGGSLDAALSSMKPVNGQSFSARYFVIHDTSAPYLEHQPFPPNLNDSSWGWNAIGRWAGETEGHLYITRDGQSTCAGGRTLGTPWRATQFEKAHKSVRGLFLHIENVQPRQCDAQVKTCCRRGKGNQRHCNDVIAPLPGFADAQLRRLALVYVAASVRGDRWLIPAYHAVLDINYRGHDDPQNFDVAKWARELNALVREMMR